MAGVGDFSLVLGEEGPGVGDFSLGLGDEGPGAFGLASGAASDNGDLAFHLAGVLTVERLSVGVGLFV